MRDEDHDILFPRLRTASIGTCSVKLSSRLIGFFQNQNLRAVLQRSNNIEFAHRSVAQLRIGGEDLKVGGLLPRDKWKFAGASKTWLDVSGIEESVSF